jgi:hypothetical protein
MKNKNFSWIILIALVAMMLIFSSSCGTASVDSVSTTPAETTISSAISTAPATEKTTATADLKTIVPVQANAPEETASYQAVTIPGQMEITVLSAGIGQDVSYNIEDKASRAVKIEVRITALTRLYVIKLRLMGDNGKETRPDLAPNTALNQGESKTFTLFYTMGDDDKNFTLYADGTPIKIGNPPTLSGDGRH